MIRVSLIAICLLVGSQPAKADVIIDVQDASITTNGTGFVDVLISSTGTDLLTTTSFEFNIGGTPAANGFLEFQLESDDANYSPPGYVFGAATGNYFDSLLPADSMFGIDNYQAGFTSVTLSGTTQTLVRLLLKHTAIGDPNDSVGKMFTVSLNTGGATDFSFWDDMGTPSPLDDGPTSLNISPLSSSGTITIASAAVPEPGTVAFLALLSTTYVARRFRRTKKKETNS
ncbi:MAG: PEP-CTERM sorting domain-containing protein [Planctomycetaceae bacterium]